jgi:lysophospholipase L1-like esterase
MRGKPSRKSEQRPVHAEDLPYHRFTMGDDAFKEVTKGSPGRSFLQIIRQLVIGLAIAGVFLAGLEGLLRLAGFEHHPPGPIIIWNNPRDREMQQSQGAFRFHPYWFWEHRPGTRIDERGIPPYCGTERINAAGYRGPERLRSPSPAVLRVVVLGDSSTFGLGVCQDQTYAALLERELPNSEVLNFGVVGFTAFQGEKLLEGRVLQYHPTVVLAAFGAIDELLPALGYDVDGKFGITSRGSPWAALWQDRLSGLRILQIVERLLSRRSGSAIPPREDVYWEKLNRGSRDYMRNQSVSSFERSLEGIVRSGQSHGARVVLIGPPRRTGVEARWPWVQEYSAAIERVASRLGVGFGDVRAAFRAVPNSDETLFLDDYHPNAAGHRMYAEFLTKMLLRDLGHGSLAGKTK